MIEQKSLQARVRIVGTVQGVGFRPFVYKLATELALRGYVLNNEEGVLILVQGEEAILRAFMVRLESEKPPLARFNSLEVEWSEGEETYDSFTIRASETGGKKRAILPADSSLCPDCLKELHDPKNRRYLYPFINCTNCGPRYTLIRALPYDRPNTSMDSFPLCPTCQKEYEDPLNRRFHAEPIACPECGPKLTLYRANGTILATEQKALETVGKLIKKGHIIAIKGIGGFHLVCDATKGRVVMELRQRKNRPTKPLAVMFRTIFDIAKCTELSHEEERLILSPERPIVLISKRRPHRLEKFAISCDSVAPNVGTMGVFLPYSPLHVLLMEQVKIPLVFTSANISGEPLVTSREELSEKLAGVFDYCLDHDRAILNPCDDSVVAFSQDRAQMIRRARGFAPSNVPLPFELESSVLALGAQQKSTLAIAFEKSAILSPHIGDLDNPSSVGYFHRTRALLEGLYHFKPEVIVADKHPEYESTRYALAQKGVKVLQVQHHYAHLLSLLSEKGITEEILGVIWDGTGYGDDGTIWGGEFLKGSFEGYQRVGHLKPFRLLGGESAIKEPRKLALSLLFDLYGAEAMRLAHPVVEAFSPEELEVLYKMHQKGLNAPWCSSIGRLFDAVAALSGMVERVSFEGECGMVMEGLYQSEAEIPNYPYRIEAGVVDVRAMIEAIVSRREEKAVVATRFINTLAQIALEVAQAQGLGVGFSGGVFQNRELSARITKLFQEAEIPCYMHESIPCNDGGIALGQVAYAKFHSDCAK